MVTMMQVTERKNKLISSRWEGETQMSQVSSFCFSFYYFLFLFNFSLFLTFWKSNAIDSSSSSYFFLLLCTILVVILQLQSCFFLFIILLSWNCISCVWLYVLTFLLCKFFLSFLHFHFCCMQLFFFFSLTLF